jgi:hypothetical protein
MKHILKLGMVIVLAMVWQHCTEDQAPAKPGDGNVRFAWRATSSTACRVGAEVSDAYAVVVSVRNAAGEEVYTHKNLVLLTLGGQFVSEPLLLKAGEHQLTEFLVIRSDGTVIFAAPLEGSALASLVQDPLPQSFVVGPEAITNLNVEVLDTENQVPEAFGYVTFGFTEVPSPVFQLAIIKPEGQSLVLSRAHVYLLEDGDTIFYQYVPARVNTINFVPHPDAQYRLMLYEDGFKRYDQYFQLDDLTNGPLEVMLEPAFTFILNNPQTFRRMLLRMHVEGPDVGNSYWIDWGDGLTIAEYTATDINTSQLEYQYIDNRPHFVSVSGNLAAIDLVAFDNIPGGAGSISLQNLPGLRIFILSTTSTPATIDFSHNPKLESLDLSQTSVASLDVSQNSLLTHIILYGNINFTTESVNAFVDGLHSNVSNRPPGPALSGDVNLSAAGESEAIGPPSEAARAKLRQLAFSFGWSITPGELLEE